MTTLQKFSAIVSKSFGIAESIFGQFAGALAGVAVEVLDVYTSTEKLTEAQTAEKSYRRGLRNTAKIFSSIWAGLVPAGEVPAVMELLGRGQKYHSQILATVKTALADGRRAELLDLFDKGISAGAIKDYFAPKAEKTVADRIETAAGDLESAVKRLWLLGAAKVAGDTYDRAVREAAAAKAKRDAVAVPEVPEEVLAA